MRGSAGRSLAAAWVVALVAGGSAGCTGDSGGTDDGVKGAQAVADKACANGTYTWFNIEKPTRLLGVSEVETLGKGGGELKNKVKRLAGVRTSVQAGSGAPAAEEILFSLGKKIGEIDSDAASVKDTDGDSWRFTKAGDTGPELNDGSVAPSGSGRFVQYVAVRVVEADFRYSCPGDKAITGRAESWTAATDGLLECDTENDSATAQEAARLSCGADSAAAKTA